jgi:hypothetical protein
MTAVLPVLLFALAGVLIGGAWSLHRQGASRPVQLVMGLLGLLALVAGAVRLYSAGA